MIEIFTRPLRVYVVLGALALCGILSGLHLPISLFPTSSQTTVSIDLPYGPLSSTQFYEAFGKDLEANLQAMKVEGFQVNELRADYRNQKVQYRAVLEWGADPEKAISEFATLVNTRFANASEEVRRGISIDSWRENSGFFAVSFYSPLRSLDELYKILEPMITPMKSQVQDASQLDLYNPNRKEITVTLLPERLAQYEISTMKIQSAIQNSVIGLNGGNFKIGDKYYLIDLPKTVEGLEAISRIRVSERGRAPIFLKDIAKITSGLSRDSNRKYKTSGVESLILFANPKEGGNVKDMSDQIMTQLKILEKQWPSDVQYKVLVNPSEFINKSVLSVVKEVFIAAFLAVVILFIFIGSFRNVVTAAIEIPLSLLMAFILMRLAGMNLNMISLGGLALSAGMNVDASVVVLENIVRHFELQKGQLTYQQKAQLILKAVNEVRLPIIASTVASLVVFLPLIFTQGLTHSLLGDLAKAVIFSHGLSAIVALVLVPTIRLQLVSGGHQIEVHSPFEKTLKAIERFYGRTLEAFLSSRKLQYGTFVGVAALLVLLVAFALPQLKKEVIGKPESDWLMVGVNSSIFTSIKQIESELDSLEADLNQTIGSEILYTFTQIQGVTNGYIMVRLKDKSKIEELVQQSEDRYKNTATKSYWVEAWNPSELEIPDPPEYRLEVTGGDSKKRLQVTQDLQNLLIEKGMFGRTQVVPTADSQKEISIKPFMQLGAESEVVSKFDMSHLLRIATDGVYVERVFQDQQELPIYLRFAQDSFTSLEHIKALPIGFEGRLIPMGALASVTIQEKEPRLYRENQRPLLVIKGRVSKSAKEHAAEKVKEAREAVQEFKSKMDTSKPGLPSLIEVQADKDLQQSLTQLKWAIVISIFLVFLTMILQLGDIIHSLLVLVAIPLGFIGVVLALFLFKSSLSLNSGLGTILLNGIAVANSIILVDFIKKLHEGGMPSRQATLVASMARIRPILMTSLTTVLGMLPIALGLGEGGKILQPLGIAVCGGLWISTLLTLYIVPALQYLYLSRKEKAR